MKEPLVSICCVTYNHEKYIKEAIYSFINQKTNFKYEILIHDDASKDNTLKKIKEIYKKYNKKCNKYFKIRLFKQDKNIYLKKNINPLINILIPNARGKYIALCEGDDFWIDEYKLQKQFDFLENNQDYIMCQHRTKVIDENNNNSWILPCNVKELTVKDILNRNVFYGKNKRFVATHTSSFFFRSILFKKYGLPPDIEKIKSGDHYINLWASLHGKIYVMEDVMSIYRIHEGSCSDIHRKSIIVKLKNQIKQYKLYKKILPLEYKNDVDYILKSLEMKLYYENKINKLNNEKLELIIKHGIYIWKKLTSINECKIALYGVGKHTDIFLNKIFEYKLKLPDYIIYNKNEILKIKKRKNIKYIKLEDIKNINIKYIVLSTTIFQNEMKNQIKKYLKNDIEIIDLYENF